MGSPVDTPGRVRNLATGIAIFFVSTLTAGFLDALAQERGWYSNPSDRLSAMLAVLRNLIGAGWFPWVCAASFGFAAGVWLDTFLRARAKNQATIPHPAPDKGFLDYQIDLQTSSADMVKVLERATRWTKWIGRKIENHSKTLMAVNESARLKQSEKLIHKAKAIANDSASDIDKFCQKITEANQKFSNIVDTMINAIRWLSTHRADWLNETTRQIGRAHV